MTAGIELINNNGVTIVNEDYTCLSLRQWSPGWASNAPSFNYPPGGVGVQDITYAGGTDPIIAIHKDLPPGRDNMGAGVMGRSYNPSTNVWTFRILVYDGFTANYSYTYYIFDDPVIIPRGSVGAELLNSGGKCVFSSGSHQMITKQHTPTLPSGKWAHCYPAGITIQNDTYDTSNGSGGVQWIDRVSYRLNGFCCTPTSVVATTRAFSQDGYDNWVPSGSEQNYATSTILVDVSRVV